MLADDAESLPTGEQLTGFAGELQQPASFNTVEQPAQVDMNAFQTTTMHDFQAEAAATVCRLFQLGAMIIAESRADSFPSSSLTWTPALSSAPLPSR